MGGDTATAWYIAQAKENLAFILFPNLQQPFKANECPKLLEVIGKGNLEMWLTEKQSRVRHVEKCTHNPYRCAHAEPWSL